VRFGLRSLLALLLSSCLICPACTTTSQVSLSPPPAATQLALEPGRKAVILLRSGEMVTGTIVAVDDYSVTVRSKSDVIRGFAFTDIDSLRTSRFSAGRTAAAVGGGLLAAGAALVTHWYLRAKNEGDE
jgi:small nuclear ribonucleoprotein (snRNP)-like protein